MNVVFADTFYYLALLNPADQAHASALHFTGTFAGRMITTDWVLTELADGLARVRTRKVAIEFIESQRNDPAVRVIRANGKLLDLGWSLYRRRPDKEWSLTDCISFVVMKKLKLSDALTGDQHFQQAGFQAVFSRGQSRN